MRSKNNTAYLVKVAMLGVLAYVVMFLEVALPFFPSFLKLDLSDLIPLLGALALGPMAGLFSELLKNLLHLITTHTGGIGELANFLVGSAFVMTAGAIYSRARTKKGAMLALAGGIFALIFSGAVVNYFVTVPLYAVVLGWPTEMIVGMGTAVIPAIHDKLTLILFAFCPFNLIKGIILSLVAIPLYKKVSPLLKQEELRRAKGKAGA